jgi:hypothetical protein
MANIIKEQKLVDNNKRTLIKYVATIDSAAANTVLVDVSQLRFALNANGYIMTSNVDPKSTYRTTIRRIFGNAKANGYIKLIWQGANNSEDIVIINDGRFDYSHEFMGDGVVINNPDPTSNGNILMTIVSPSATDALTLFIELRKDSLDYDAGQTADPVAFNRGF